ncbi:MAG: GFA family protein [Rhodobacteraceae bacterium]|nr:GFA family protein [Paracoccaceae bacterium]
MSGAERRSGQCLCGAVRVSAEVTGPGIQACHCHDCQRWTGGGPFLVVGVRDVVVTGAERVADYRHSSWGERGSCATCGSPVYWRLQGGEIEGLAIGLFEDQTGWHVTSEIFVDHRPGWLPPWPGAMQATEAEQIAKFDAALQGETQ